MKSYVKTMKFILLVGIIVPSLSFAQTHRAYADELFKKSDYYKAFFLYRNLYGSDLNENQFAQRCNQAMVLTKQFVDLRATKKYYDAKTKLRELLDINPDDFHAPLLPQLSIEEANYWQRLALKQNSAMEINLMLEKAIALYQQGQKDGWNHKEIDDAIKQCEISKVTSGISENGAILSSTKIPLPVEIAQDTTAKVAVQVITDIPNKEEIKLEKTESEEKKLPTELKIVKTPKQNISPRKYVASTIK